MTRGGSSSTGRAPDCGSGRCGFDSRLPPQTLSLRQKSHHWICRGLTVKYDHRSWPDVIGITGNGSSIVPLNDVVRRIEGGIDPTAPRMSFAAARPRQFKIERLPVSICDQMKQQVFL